MHTLWMNLTSYQSIACTEIIPEEPLCDKDFVLNSVDSGKATGADKISEEDCH